MNNNEINNLVKEDWTSPTIFYLDIRKTEGGEYLDTNEDFGTINTQPGS